MHDQSSNWREPLGLLNFTSRLSVSTPSASGNRRSSSTLVAMATLSDVMRTEFITVAPEDTLGEVAEKMTALNVGSVVVKDFGKLIGILTERDLLKAMAARVHSSEARVRQFMTENPITVSPDMDCEDAE